MLYFDEGENASEKRSHPFPSSLGLPEAVRLAVRGNGGKANYIPVEVVHGSYP